MTMSLNGLSNYAPQYAYNDPATQFGGGSSVESEAAKADALQVEKMKLVNKATYQNNYTAYVQKLQ